MLKKTIGFVLLFIGGFLENLGMYGLGDTDGKENAMGFIDHDPLFRSYQHEHEVSMFLAPCLIILGLMGIIAGLTLIATNTRAQRQMEIELKILRAREKDRIEL